METKSDEEVVPEGEELVSLDDVEEIDAAEVGRLENRISELRIEAARAFEERQELMVRLGTASAELRDARARIAGLEAEVARHEQRVVKAYQRLKGDERVREKARKALTIALQLLDEGAQRAGEAAGLADSAPTFAPK